MNRSAVQRHAPKRPHKPTSQRLGPRRLVASVTRGRGPSVWVDHLPPAAEIGAERWHLLVDQFVRGTLRHDFTAEGVCRACTCGCPEVGPISSIRSTE